MNRVIEGEESAEGLHIGVAATTWNPVITERLLEAAVARLEEINAGQITVLRVPGALELPIAARALVGSGCDGVVAIGTIVKGDTDHYEIVVRESTAGIASVALDADVPVANAILAVHQYEDAVERSGPGPSNKGVEATDAVVCTATALRKLKAG